MSGRWLRLLFAPYPRAWKDRYLDEVRVLTEDLWRAGEMTTGRLVVSALSGAIVAHARSATLRARRSVVLPTGTAIVLAIGLMAVVAHRPHTITGQDGGGVVLVSGPSAPATPRTPAMWAFPSHAFPSHVGMVDAVGTAVTTVACRDVSGSVPAPAGNLAADVSAWVAAGGPALRRPPPRTATVLG